MHATRFLDNTEEAFVLANVKEFVKLWGSGRRANLQLECQNGQAFIKFSSQLGAPADRHFTPHIPQHGLHEAHHHFPRHKGPKQRERDRARAAAHRTKLASQANSSIEPAAAAGANATATLYCIATLYSIATGTTPTPPVPSADSAVKPHAPLPKAAAVVTPATVVEDEVCPDTEYASVDDDDIGSNGRTAFRCSQCQMLYLPEDHEDGNEIVNYELCRRHIGVYKCESCARVIVGLARIRCHRQVCQDPA